MIFTVFSTIQVEVRRVGTGTQTLTSAMLVQLIYQANWELVVMWVDNKPVDDGYRSMKLYQIYHIHEFRVLR